MTPTQRSLLHSKFNTIFQSHAIKLPENLTERGIFLDTLAHCFVESYASDKLTDRLPALTYPRLLGVLSKVAGSMSRQTASSLLVKRKNPHRLARYQQPMTDSFTGNACSQAARLHFAVRNVLRHMVFTDEEGQPLAKRPHSDAQHLSSKVLRPTPNKGHAAGPSGTPHVLVASAQFGRLWRPQTECKKSRAEPTVKTGEPRTESFEFSVNLTTIRQRIAQKRGPSQQTVYGDSAKAVFQALGAVIYEKASRRGSHYHLAHRHGFSLGGAQSKENLDPATEGSNYSTWALVEAPIKQLILDETLTAVTVRGEVHFDTVPEIPLRVDYHISGENERASIKVSIHPRDHRKPTISEHKAMLQFIELAKALVDDDEVEEQTSSASEPVIKLF